MEEIFHHILINNLSKTRTTLKFFWFRNHQKLMVIGGTTINLPRSVTCNKLKIGYVTRFDIRGPLTGKLQLWARFWPRSLKSTRT